MAGRAGLLLLLLTVTRADIGPGPIVCDVINSCGAGQTCCPTPHARAGEWGCCGAPNATCCADLLHCCPQDFPVCGAGTCTKSDAAGAAAVPWVRRRTYEETAAAARLGSAPPPPPPPALYPFECTSTKIGCFAEAGAQGDGWPPTQRLVPRRPTQNATMPFGEPMSVTACARFCHQGMALVDWTTSPYNVTIAGNHLCGCSVGVPASDPKSGLPKRVDDSLCTSPCPANGTETCGDLNQTVVSAYAFSCSAVPAPLHLPICNLNFSQWWNGSDVSYKQWIDCFGKGDTAYGSLYVNDHFTIQPHHAVLCNITRDPWYCDFAAASLAAYAMGGVSGGYHCYEDVLAFASVAAGTGLKDAGLNATALAKFKQLVVQGCGSQARHSAKVENHAIDAALQQAYAPRVFPDIIGATGVTGWKGEAEMVYENWMHAHALDESAINYDGISIVRLVALLRLGSSDDPNVASFPLGPSDLHSVKFKAFLYEYADSITASGCFSNHGGGLQDDGQGFCNGAHLFGFFFEQGATSFQRSGPEAAAYFKWAARSMWRNLALRDYFASFYWSPALAYEEELKQLAAGGPIPIPDLVDLNSTIVMKSEYQHDATRHDGCVSNSTLPGLRGGCFPKKLVVCSSRKPGSAYVQQDIYAVPPGYHGVAHQAGTMNHYEFGTTLFLEAGSRTKHVSQTDASTGMPTIMPDSDSAAGLFPWRWGQHNIARGKIQVQEYATQDFGETQHAPPNTNGTNNFGPGDWYQYWPVDMSAYSSDGKQGIEFVCQGQPNKTFSVAIGPLTLVGPAGTKVVDSFDYAARMPDKPWGAGSSWLYEWPGSAAQPWLKISCSANPQTPVRVLRPVGATPSVDYVFQAYDYTHLRHEYMVDDSFIVSNTKGATASGAGYGSSEYLNLGIPLSSSFGFVTNSFRPVLNDVVAHTSAAGDAHGGYNMSGFGGYTASSFWTRHMVLLKEGGLIVLDSITPTALQGGWLGGPRWQMQMNCSANATAKPCQMEHGADGSDWADLSGFGRTTTAWQRATGNEGEAHSLVAKFGAAPNRTHGLAAGSMAPPSIPCQTIGKHNIPQPCFPPGEWWGFPWQTLWTKQRYMQPGERELFVSVFVPYLRSKTTGSAVQAGVSISQAKEAGSATVKVGPLTVTLDVHGAWSVLGRQ